MTGKNSAAPELIWSNGKLEGNGWSLIQSVCVGRENADIIIPVDAVSRKHAQVHVATGYFAIEDLVAETVLH